MSLEWDAENSNAGARRYNSTSFVMEILKWQVKVVKVVSFSLK